jgi:tetratricopeptide (TPR) repeat protein
LRVKRFDRLEFDEPDPLRPPELSTNTGEERDERYWLNRADAERREGLHENALRYYSRALEINKSVVEAWVSQVQMLIALGEYPEAELWSRKALELFRNNGDLLAARAHAMVRIGNLLEALPLSDTALKQEGQSPYRWMVRGEIMLARKQDMEQHCFDKAVQLDKDWLVLVEIGQIYRYRGKPTKAVIRLRQAVERVPDRPYCWYVQGCCERELGLYPAAKRSFLQCLELKPGHSDARRSLIELERKYWSIGCRLKRWLHLS